MAIKTRNDNGIPNLVVTGFKGHGKDTACYMLYQRFGIPFITSSAHACETFLFEQMVREGHPYRNAAECFADRDNHRDYWYEAIRAYNGDDPARMGREIFGRVSVYCGLRHMEELQALKAEGLVDAVVWIDASSRKPPEAASSMSIPMSEADYVIDNNGTKMELESAINQFVRATLPVLC
jgi:hypothetical protein